MLVCLWCPSSLSLFVLLFLFRSFWACDFYPNIFSFGPYHGAPLQFDNMFHLVWIWNHHLFSNLPSWCYSCVCLSQELFARTWRRYKKLDSNIVRTCFCKRFANNSGWWIRVVDLTQISSLTYCLWCVYQHICISVSWMLHPWTECMG